MLDQHVQAQMPFNWLVLASLLLGLMYLPAGDQTVQGGPCDMAERVRTLPLER